MQANGGKLALMKAPIGRRLGDVHEERLARRCVSPLSATGMLFFADRVLFNVGGQNQIAKLRQGSLVGLRQLLKLAAKLDGNSNRKCGRLVIHALNCNLL
jgi:hypothetical protein